MRATWIRPTDCSRRCSSGGRLPERDAEQRRFVLGVANERGRLLRRRGELDQAEELLRMTIEQARRPVTTPWPPRPRSTWPACCWTAAPSRPPTRRSSGCRTASRNWSIRLKATIALRRSTTWATPGRRDPKLAEDYFRRAEAVARELNDPGALVDAVDRLGGFLAEQGRLADAEAAAARAVRLCERIYDPRRQGRTLANLGAIYLQLASPNYEPDPVRRAADTLAIADRWFAEVDVPQLRARRWTTGDGPCSCWGSATRGWPRSGGASRSTNAGRAAAPRRRDSGGDRQYLTSAVGRGQVVQSLRVPAQSLAGNKKSQSAGICYVDSATFVG